MKDTMQVKLISYTQLNPGAFRGDVDPYADTPNTAQELVAFCARVSNPSNQFNKETSERLIQYLIRHQHWSPFEMVSACLEIETTRDIARQILRHRSFSFQEFSQRYADPLNELHLIPREARLQDTSNRQNSIQLNFANPEHRELARWWLDAQNDILKQVRDTYRQAISLGIAKEVARSILPEGNTMSRMYMNGTLRSWIHYIELRSANGTQLEHQEIARACAEVISKIFPMMTSNGQLAS